ncbi:MAG: hypothetical protein AB7I27_13370 [Bacteriovoracaceae bacterium]
MKTFVTLLSVFFIFNASAGHDTGSGGIGIEVDKKIYLYDFVEAGIEENVFIKSGMDDEMGASIIVKATLLTSKEVQDLVTAKLNEIYKNSPTAALKLLQTLRKYQWRFVKPSLIRTADIGKTPIKLNLDEKQLAYRDDNLNVVTIDKDLLARMPISHQVGLYFHEILYAISKDNDSSKARTVNAYLFHPSFEYTDLNALRSEFYLIDEKENYVSYSEYKYINSQNYQQKCDTLKKEADDHIMSSLTFLENLLREFYRIGQASETDDKAGRAFPNYYQYATTEVIVYNGKSFTILDENYYGGKYSENIYSYWGNDFVGVLYAMPVATKQTIDNIRNKSNDLISKQVSEEFGKGRCLMDYQTKRLVEFSKYRYYNN